MDDFKNLIDNLVRDGYTINTGSLSFSKQLNGSIVTVKIDKTPNDIYCKPENQENTDNQEKNEEIQKGPIKTRYRNAYGETEAIYLNSFNQPQIYCVATSYTEAIILRDGYCGGTSIASKSLLTSDPYSSRWYEYTDTLLSEGASILAIDIEKFMQDHKNAKFIWYREGGEITTNCRIPPAYIHVFHKEKEIEHKNPNFSGIFAKGYLLRPKHELKKILKEGLSFRHSAIMLKTRKPMKYAKNSVILSIDLAKYAEDRCIGVESKSKDSPVIHVYLGYEMGYHIPAEYITVEEPEPKYQSIRTTEVSDYFAEYPIGFYVGNKAYNGLTMEDNSIDTPEEGRYIELSLSLPYVRAGATIYSVDLEAFVNNNPEADITIINPHDKKEAAVLVREDIPAEYVKPGVEYPKYSDDYLNTEPGKAIMKDLEKESK